MEELSSNAAIGMARDRVAQLIWGYTASLLVCIAAKLGIADRLSPGAKYPEEIASEAQVNSGTMHRLLRGFETCGLVRSLEDGRFELTDHGQWLRSEKLGSLHTIAVRTHDLYYPAWNALLAAVEVGQPAFTLAFGTDYYTYLSSHSEHVRTFNALMSAMCVQGAQAVLAAYDFGNAHHVVDLGGGEGILLCELLKSNPDMRGTLFDTPAVVDCARQVVELAGVADRCSIVSGDFLASVPVCGDIYILKHVLHNWSDQQCVRILRNCRAVMDSKACLLVIERVMDRMWSPMAVRSDLHMLVLMNGAERTEAEFEMMLATSGFRLQRSVHTGSAEHILEAVAS